MRVALYARVSSEKQAEKDLSIPSQLKALRKYALQRNWEIIDEYIDEAESARSVNRPAFQEMITAAKKKDKPRIKEPHQGMSFDDLLAYAKAHGESTGWIFKTTTLNISEANEDPYKCAMEIKAIAGW